MSEQLPPDWAIERACQIVNADGSEYSRAAILDPGSMVGSSLGKAFARYIAEHEEAPVDPLLIEARNIAAETLSLTPNDKAEYIALIRSGGEDHNLYVTNALTALRRGIEIGRGEV